MKHTLRLCVSALIILPLFGCASVSYQTANGDQLKYTRLGFQSIEGLELSDGTHTVKVAKSSTHLDAENVAAISAAAIQAANAAK